MSRLGLITRLSAPFLASSTVTTKRKVTAEGLLPQAESNGYKRGSIERKRALEATERHRDKTKKDQDSALDRYIL
jgi:hypothetical protein